MRVRGWLLGSAVALSLVAPEARAQTLSARRFSVAPFVGWTTFDSELRSASGPMFENNYDFGGRASARVVSIFWLDFAAGITSAKPCDCNESWSHYSANIMMMGVNPRRITPYLSLGGGISMFRPMLTADKRDGTVEAAGGVRVRIADGMGVRIEARQGVLVPKEDWFKNAHIRNTVVGLGLVYAFGGKPPDTDGDGVPDRKDKCPNTPPRCTVDAKGCTVDSDGDGVCDGGDQCPDTPKGANVDAKGCPLDTDGDGIYDGLDQCAATKKGCTVDATGCPADADSDGVCDGLDQCPSTPKGCTVDAKGCPADADSDGVCDGLDRCPGTRAGAHVDPVGCEIVQPGTREYELLDTGKIRISSISFDVGKADVAPSSFAVLDTVGNVLTKWPALKIEIGGHTDSRGSDKANQALSERRAAAVRSYLLAHFTTLAPDQITSKGYGESRPVVPNSTPAMMKINRRVEFVVLNREVLKREK